MSSTQEEYSKFLKFCKENLTGTDKPLLSLIKKRYNECSDLFCDSRELCDLLAGCREKMERDKRHLFVHLKDCLNQLKSYSCIGGKRKRAAEYDSDDSVWKKSRKSNGDLVSDATSGSYKSRSLTSSPVNEEEEEEKKRGKETFVTMVTAGNKLKITAISPPVKKDGGNNVTGGKEWDSKLKLPLGFASQKLQAGKLASVIKSLADKNVNKTKVPERVLNASPDLFEDSQDKKNVSDDDCIVLDDTPVKGRKVKSELNDGSPGKSTICEESLPVIDLCSPEIEITSKSSKLDFNSRKKADFLSSLNLGSSTDEETTDNKVMSNNEKCSVVANLCKRFKATSSHTARRDVASKDNGVPPKSLSNCAKVCSELEEEIHLEKQSKSSKLSLLKHHHKIEDSSKSSPRMGRTSSSESDLAIVEPVGPEHPETNKEKNGKIHLATELSDMCSSAVGLHPESSERADAVQEDKSSVPSTEAVPEPPIPDPALPSTSGSTSTAGAKKKSPSKSHVKRLEKLLGNLQKKITQYQERELTLDDMDQEDSSYLYEDKLKRKFVTVWNKLCQLKERPSTTGRPIERRFVYEGTRYPEVNRKIERRINRTKAFPDFHDIKKVVSRVNKRHKMNLSSVCIDSLAREAFIDVGNMLQQRRKEDYETTFGSKITDASDQHSDPADQDPMLRRKLDENMQKGKSNIDAVIRKYSNMQYKHDSPSAEPSGSPEAEQSDDSEAEPGDYPEVEHSFEAEHSPDAAALEEDVMLVTIEDLVGRNEEADNSDEEMDTSKLTARPDNWPDSNHVRIQPRHVIHPGASTTIIDIDHSQSAASPSGQPPSSTASNDESCFVVDGSKSRRSPVLKTNNSRLSLSANPKNSKSPLSANLGPSAMSDEDSCIVLDKDIVKPELGLDADTKNSKSQSSVNSPHRPSAMSDKDSCIVLDNDIMKRGLELDAATTNSKSRVLVPSPLAESDDESCIVLDVDKSVPSELRPFRSPTKCNKSQTVTNHHTSLKSSPASKSMLFGRKLDITNCVTSTPIGGVSVKSAVALGALKSCSPISKMNCLSPLKESHSNTPRKHNVSSSPYKQTSMDCYVTSHNKASGDNSKSVTMTPLKKAVQMSTECYIDVDEPDEEGDYQDEEGHCHGDDKDQSPIDIQEEEESLKIDGSSDDDGEDAVIEEGVKDRDRKLAEDDDDAVIEQNDDDAVIEQDDDDAVIEQDDDVVMKQDDSDSDIIILSDSDSS